MLHLLFLSVDQLPLRLHRLAPRGLLLQQPLPQPLKLLALRLRRDGLLVERAPQTVEFALEIFALGGFFELAQLADLLLLRLFTLLEVQQRVSICAFCVLVKLASICSFVLVTQLPDRSPPPAFRAPCGTVHLRQYLYFCTGKASKASTLR